MRDLALSISRRTALAGVAGGLLKAPNVLHAATGGRAVVCLGLFDSQDGASMLVDRSRLAIRSGRKRYWLNSALGDVASLYQQNQLAVVTGIGAREGDGATPRANGRGFLESGFSVPAWMLDAVGASQMQADGKVCTFDSGLTMLSPSPMPGPQHENPAWSGVAANAAFPDTSLGRQLRQVAGILASGGGPFFVTGLSGQGTVGDAEAQRTQRYRELGAALTAFEACLVANGLDRQVIIYTDPGFGELGLATEADSASVQLMAGAVLGGMVYANLAGGRNTVSAAIADWAGFRADLLFPAVQLPVNRFTV